MVLLALKWITGIYVHSGVEQFTQNYGTEQAQKVLFPPETQLFSPEREPLCPSRQNVDSDRSQTRLDACALSIKPRFSLSFFLLITGASHLIRKTNTK